jgi:hypothetical protein
MDDTIITIYCFLREEFLEAIGTGMTLKSGSTPPR